MSIYGMQLPKQLQVQKQSGAVTKNQGGAVIYASPLARKTSSFQWKSYQKPRPEHYQKIQAGTGTVMRDQFVRTGNFFDVTLRNSQHPFHSRGPRQVAFNDVTYNELKQRSRFGEATNTMPASPAPIKDINPIDRELYYDIKGNTFKNTLIPEQTAQNLFTVKKLSQTSSNFGRSVSNVKVKPQYKGYVRSGQMLFNNIGQMNTWDY